MRRAFPWLLLGAGIAALLALALFGQAPAPPSTHSSRSAAADGTSALFRAAPSAARLDAPSTPAGGLLFIFSPNKPFTDSQARGIYGFVHAGGTLVYAAEQPDPALEGRFGILRDSSSVVHDVVAYAPGPLLPGVHEVSGGAAAVPFLADSDQVPIIRGPLGEVLAFEQRVGRGRLIALADPLPLCNGYILRSDNAAFAADILGAGPAGSPVFFDESHHIAAAAAPAAPAAQAAGTSPWIYALIWAIVAGYIGLALRGRAFGPPIPLEAPRARSTAEYVDAVGNLLRRSGGRREAAEILLSATRRALGRRLGGRALPADRLEDVLAQRRPELAQRLRAAEQAGAADSEAALLDTARNLHELERL